MPAQGNALGLRPAANHQALKGRSSRPAMAPARGCVGPPLQGLGRAVARFPRALPWAAIGAAPLGLPNTALARAEREIGLLREYRTRLIADVVTGKLDVRAAARQLPETRAEGESVTEAEDSPELEAEEATGETAE